MGNLSPLNEFNTHKKVLNDAVTSMNIDLDFTP